MEVLDANWKGEDWQNKANRYRKAQTKGLPIRRTAGSNAANLIKCCYPGSVCREYATKYPFLKDNIFPVCPFVRKTLQWTPQPLPTAKDSSLKEIALRCVKRFAEIVSFKPTLENIDICAHRDILKEYLDPIREDMERLPILIEKEFPETAKQIRYLIQQLLLCERNRVWTEGVIYVAPEDSNVDSAVESYSAWVDSVWKEIEYPRSKFVYPIKAIRVCLALSERLSAIVSLIAAANKGSSQGTKIKAKALQYRMEKAYQTYKAAEEKLGKCTDREAYEWVKENLPTEVKDLPSLETWTNYVRKARKHHNEPKNQKRYERPESGCKISDDPELLSQISNQYRQR